MKDFQRERMACAYFFASIGLSYGIFTARMPALRELVSANDAQIGFLLLAFGGASFAGLLSSRFVVGKWGPKAITILSAPCAIIFLTIAALGYNYLFLVLFCILSGIWTGLCDVAMNAQAISIERRHHVLCMSSLHASFSLGGVLGSLAGSLFAWLECSTFLNFLWVCGLWLLLWLPAAANLKSAEQKHPATGVEGENVKLPFFIYFCGLMAMLCYVSEGSVGEWGSVLLHTVKNAPQDQAALVFAFFSGAMVFGRSLGDSLRRRFPDHVIVGVGGSLGTLGMAIVLLSPWPILCLAAYLLMGLGFAPIVPILYSRAGDVPGIPLAKTSSTVSIMAYTGMLFFPPLLGMLGQSLGLGNALWIIVLTCACVAAGSRFLKKHGLPMPRRSPDWRG